MNRAEAENIGEEIFRTVGLVTNKTSRVAAIADVLERRCELKGGPSQSLQSAAQLASPQTVTVPSGYKDLRLRTEELAALRNAVAVAISRANEIGAQAAVLGFIEEEDYDNGMSYAQRIVEGLEKLSLTLERAAR